MPEGFDMLENLEQQNEQQIGNLEQLTQLIKDNLDRVEPASELPDWVRKNLEGDKPERQLDILEILGNIVREIFHIPSEKVVDTVKSFDPAESFDPADVVHTVEVNDTAEVADTVEERYDVDEATDVWHVQTEPYSCANACQEFIIDEYLNIDVQEEDLNAYARENNWLQEGGTSLEDVGNLLEAYGIETHRYMNADFADIKEALNNGDRVIVAVYNAALDEDWSDSTPVVTANHAIEVIGVDDSDPNNVKVIINDPGVEDGCGKVVSLDTFNQARDGSGGFMVVAERP